MNVLRLHITCVLLLPNVLSLRVHYSAVKPNYVGTVEMSGSITITSTLSVVECTMSCSLKDKCLTYFFNSITGECVMHSKDFNFQTPSMTSPGWQYYVNRDGKLFVYDLLSIHTHYIHSVVV